MFCRIKNNDKTLMYTVYLCERKRINGKIKSKDIKIIHWNYLSLYDYEEKKEGIKEEIPKEASKLLRRILASKKLESYFPMIIDKLKDLKKEKYKLWCTTGNKEKEKLYQEYKSFRNKYSIFITIENQEWFENGYNQGYNDRLRNNKNSYINNLDSLSSDDRKLLNKVFKAAALKYHPDKQNGDTETMQKINILKDKILK